MKHKATTDIPVTKADIDRLEKATKTDIGRLQADIDGMDKKFEELEKRMDKKFEEQDKKFDEKLDRRFTAFENAFRAEMDHKFEMFKEEIHEMMSGFTNRILTAIDPLLQELETRQQDRTLTTAQMSELRDITNDHETRIRKLEHS